MRTNALRAATGAAPTTKSESLTRALFHVVGDTDPSLLPRVVEPAAKLGLVPTRVHASAEDGDGSRLTIDLRLGVVPEVAAKRIESALRGIVGVVQVIAVYEAA